MNFREHAIAGAATGTSVAAASYLLIPDIQELAPLTLGLCVFAGSLAPDLDTASKPSKWTARVLLVWSILALLKSEYQSPFDELKHLQWLFEIKLVLWIDTSFIAFKSCKHRGISHKYVFPIAVFALAWFMSNPWLIASGIGIIVHYLVDKIYPTPKNLV